MKSFSTMVVKYALSSWRSPSDLCAAASWFCLVRRAFISSNSAWNLFALCHVFWKASSTVWRSWSRCVDDSEISLSTFSQVPLSSMFRREVWVNGSNLLECCFSHTTLDTALLGAARSMTQSMVSSSSIVIACGADREVWKVLLIWEPGARGWGTIFAIDSVSPCLVLSGLHLIALSRSEMGLLPSSSSKRAVFPYFGQKPWGLALNNGLFCGFTDFGAPMICFDSRPPLLLFLSRASWENLRYVRPRKSELWCVALVPFSVKSQENYIAVRLQRVVWNVELVLSTKSVVNSSSWSYELVSNIESVMMQLKSFKVATASFVAQCSLTLCLSFFGWARHECRPIDGWSCYITHVSWVTTGQGTPNSRPCRIISEGRQERGYELGRRPRRWGMEIVFQH